MLHHPKVLCYFSEILAKCLRARRASRLLRPPSRLWKSECGVVGGKVLT